MDDQQLSGEPTRCVFLSKKRRRVVLMGSAHERGQTEKTEKQLLFFVFRGTTCKVIGKSPVKSCCLDPVPVSVAKQCLTDLDPLIAKIVNQSLCTVIVSNQFKQVVVTKQAEKFPFDLISCFKDFGKDLCGSIADIFLKKQQHSFD